MTGYIYKITNLLNGKLYIGQTSKTIEERFLEHKADATKREFEKRPLYDAMKKYGIENFSIELVEEVSLIEINEREKYWISYFNSYHNGYNATLGGEGKILYDYDFLAKEFALGKSIKEIAQEQKCSPETVSSAVHAANMNSQLNSRTKQKKKIAAKTLAGEIVKIFNSRADAVKWLQAENLTTCASIDGISTNIGRVANGKREQAYGFKWENIE